MEPRAQQLASPIWEPLYTQNSFHHCALGSQMAGPGAGEQGRGGPDASAEAQSASQSLPAPDRQAPVSGKEKTHVTPNSPLAV